MRLLLWNVRSLTNNLKIHFILHTLDDNKVDIACITETWLSPELGHNHSISIIKSRGYTISFHSRNDRCGGGVAFILKSGIKFKPFKHLTTYTSFEWHGIQVFGCASCYRLLCVYRKQEVSMITFVEELSHFMQLFCSNTTDEIILLGDFNVHFHTRDKKSLDLVDVVDQYGLCQAVLDPTRISGYTLDLIFSNPFSLPLQPHVAENLSETRTDRIKFDHFPILFQIADHF